MARVTTKARIDGVHANFARIYLGGIPSILNDEGAFLSFICCLTAMEALGGFIEPDLSNGPRLKAFVKRYMPEPLKSQADDLWQFRNAAVHGFSPGPYVLTHHNGHMHLRKHKGRVMLNAEDFYALLVQGSKSYFDDLRNDRSLQSSFLKRVKDPKTGVLVVGPIQV